MKSNFLLFAILVLCYTGTFSQYSVTVSQEAYSNLSGGTELSFSATDGGYYHATNFQFTTFENRVANFRSNANPPSAGAYVTPYGYVAVYETPGYANTIAFQAFYNADLYKTDGITKVSAKTEGTSGNRTLNFEFRDLVYNNDTNQRVSFRVKLHEADSTFSYHFGPNTLSSRAIYGFCGVVVFNPSFTALLDECNVQGSPLAPNVYDSITSLQALPYLDSFPQEGTVLSFKIAEDVVIPPTGQEEIHAATPRFFPNPATDLVYMPGLVAATEVCITNMLGEVVLNTVVTPGSPGIDVHILPAGQYFLLIHGSKPEYHRLVVAK